jgi:glycosyltransferase involved in cell wall biosynthesis
MKKIVVCGDFSFGYEAVGGQTIKTRLITDELKKIYGEDEVLCVDTRNWRKKPFKLLFNCIRLSIVCKNVIILPAHNGIKVFIPLFVLLSKIFGTKLHYIVVGAWLAKELKKNSLLLKITKHISYIYAQTNTLKKRLNEININNNVHIMRNFKLIEPISPNEIVIEHSLPYKLCMLSRVDQKKGFEDAIEVVKKINKKHSKTIVKLDIYGPIKEDYKNRFFSIIKQHSSFVSYKGTVDHDKTVAVLKEYYLLLFPTKYFTEGIPGTILDAYLSGVPVLASRWESYSDVIVEGHTGFTYEFDNTEDFYSKLEFLVENYNLVINLRKKCLIESNKYNVDKAMGILVENLS